MPQVVEQIIEVPKMTEQILDVLVPKTVEQSVQLPSTVSEGGHSSSAGCGGIGGGLQGFSTGQDSTVFRGADR